QCPTGLACATLPNGVKACAPAGAGVDQPCALSDGSSCGPRGSGGLCFEGLCEPACNGGVCGAGRICSGSSAGGCLVDCTSGGSCGTNQQCSPVWHNGKSGCMATGHSVAACSNATAQAPCDASRPPCPTNDLPVGIQCPAFT